MSLADILMQYYLGHISPDEKLALQERIYGLPDGESEQWEQIFDRNSQAQDARGKRPGDMIRDEVTGEVKKQVKNGIKNQVKDYIFGEEHGSLGVGAAGAEAVNLGTSGAGELVTPIGNGLSTPVTAADYSAIQAGSGAANGVEAAAVSPWLQYGAGGAAALYGGYNLAKHWGQDNWKQGAMDGATTGAGIGTMVMPGLGTAVGAGAGALWGAALGSIKVGKHKDQMKRDSVRQYMISQGILNPDFSLDLADGQKGDMGVDGGFKYQNVDGSSRRAYETDTSNPLTHQAIGWANPLAEMIANGDDKARSDLAGQFVNLATKEAKDLEAVRANMKAIFARMGGDSDAATARLKMIYDGGGMSEDEFNSAVYGLSTLMSGKYDPNQRPKNEDQKGQQTQPTFQNPVPSRPDTSVEPNSTWGVPGPNFNDLVARIPPGSVAVHPINKLPPGAQIPGYNAPANQVPAGTTVPPWLEPLARAGVRR